LRRSTTIDRSLIRNFGAKIMKQTQRIVFPAIAGLMLGLALPAAAQTGAAP